MAKRIIGAAGRFRTGHGKKVRDKVSKVEAKQRKKQKCPFCNRLALKRLAKGIWKCKKCGKKIASSTYYVE